MRKVVCIETEEPPAISEVNFSSLHDLFASKSLRRLFFILSYASSNGMVSRLRVLDQDCSVATACEELPSS